MSATHHTLVHAGTSTTIQIPRGVAWSDELEWAPVDTAAERGITGALIVDAAVKVKGRPVTLASLGSDQGFITRAVLLELQELAEIPLAKFELTLADGREMTVMFAPGEIPVEAEPVGKPELPTDDNLYTATLRFVTA
jgi:hypothetical protein